MSTGHFGRAVPVGLRRFPLLHGKTLGGSKFEFPTQLPDAPFHVVTMNFRNKNVWNARSWHGLQSSLEILQTHAVETKPGMYYLWLLPTVHWLWAPIWKRRCRAWANENGISENSVVVVYGNRDEITDEIGIHNDGRMYAFLMRNTGKVFFATDGRYLSNKHDFHIHKAINTMINQDMEDRGRKEMDN